MFYIFEFVDLNLRLAVWGWTRLQAVWRRFRGPGPEPKRVVIVGASFAGLTSLRHLRRPDIHLTLVDQKDYFEFAVVDKFGPGAKVHVWDWDWGLKDASRLPEVPYVATELTRTNAC